MIHRFCLIALAALVLMSPGHVGAQNNIDALAEELVRLRGQVEALNTELNQLQEQHGSRMRSLAAQRGDLEATERRERLTVERLQRDLEQLQLEASEAGVAAEDLKPVALASIDALADHIEQGFAFKVEERREALADIRDSLQSGSLSPPRAINRLWHFYEDELRLTRENGLYSQIIPLDGERVLADVAKIGTVALYFVTRDGRTGVAERAGSGWQFQVVDERQARQQIEALFDSLRKQIRSGYFELPNAAIELELSE